MSYLIPSGFSDLVNLVIDNWTWDDLPNTQDDVWNSLMYTVFLGETVRSAQATYARDVFGSFINFENSRSVSDPKWSEKALALVKAENSKINATPGEGYKKAMLKNLETKISNLDVSRTIDTALKFFDQQNITVQKIVDLKADSKATLDLVDRAARNIHDVRYIKAVIWLYGCGIAEELVPPNNHVIRFLNECGYPGFGWSSSPKEDWEIIAPLCKCMKDVANIVSSELSTFVTPKQAQAAVWYLQSCRGLLPPRQARKFTPDDLVGIIKAQGWKITELNDILDDVEELENLSSILKM